MAFGDHRKPLRRMSATQAKAQRAKAPIREAVFARDRGCLLARHLGGCFGELTAHHLRKDGQGGAYAEENLVTLCSFHNDTWVEGNPLEAHRLGLVVRRGETVADAWKRMREHHLVPDLPRIIWPTRSPCTCEEPADTDRWRDRRPPDPECPVHREGGPETAA